MLFQQTMARVFTGLLCHTLELYLDDIIVYGHNEITQIIKSVEMDCRG
jgi:hypothetical protein